jgi:hypothetical protein
MRIVSAGDFHVKHFLNNLSESLSSIGCELTVFDLGGLDFGIPYHVENVKSTCMHKPQMIMKALDLFNDKWIVYLDADTMMLSPINEIQEGDYDVGVTLRRPDEKISRDWGRINAGVIFFNNNANTRKFVVDWDKKTQQLGDDQAALNEIFESKNKQVRFKTFPTDVYNFYYFNETFNLAKILHFKGGFPREFYNNRKKKIL